MFFRGLPRATPIVPLLAACLSAGLGACSSDVNPMRAAGFGLKPVEAPDFVAQSRRSGGDFMPVGVNAPARSVRAKGAEGQRDLAADLEAARGRNQTRGRAAEGAGSTAAKDLKPAAPPTE